MAKTNNDSKNSYQNLNLQARAVLSLNSINGLVIPARGLYPHRVLWDSCFIGIGLSHYDIEASKRQILSFLDAQWSDGMVPHIIFNSAPRYFWDRFNWHSWLSPLSVKGLPTSGITQPPMFAEAVYRIGSKLTKTERQIWYKSVFDKLVRYHSWLYENRDLKGDGLITLIHPWETGLDNTPPWLASLNRRHTPLFINLLVWSGLIKIGDHLRIDGKYVDFNQRSTSIEALRLYGAQRIIRRKRYNNSKILKKPMFAIEDLAYNSIFIRANSLLRAIALEIDQTLPKSLLISMSKTETNLDELWDINAKTYYPRNEKYGYFLKEDSVAALLPLYSGAISKERAEHLLVKLNDKQKYNTVFPVPSVPVSSKWFKPMRYWQGPSWININWLLIDGLKRYGFVKEAENLAIQTIELVKKSGFYEYFNPITGQPAGVKNFSWTAALIIDLIEEYIG